MSQSTGLPTPEEKRAILDGYRRQYGLTTFVETGTLFGDTVEALRSVFERVVSIELSEELAAKARERFAGCGNVTILQGDSGQVLPRVLETLTGPALFWLDGHYSGDFQSRSRGLVRTARGELQTPVVQELASILADKEPGHVVLIDDARLFDGTNDYPTIDALRATIDPGAGQLLTVERDIIRVVP
jgi:hypothetical protein